MLGGWGGLSRRCLLCGISECGSRVGLQRKCSNTFALAVVKQFRANQGVLLAGAVAYYTLLSLNVVVMFTQRLTSATRYLWRSLAEGARKVRAWRERHKAIEDIREARGKTLLARMAVPRAESADRRVCMFRRCRL